MCTNGPPSNTDADFAPYSQRQTTQINDTTSAMGIHRQAICRLVVIVMPSPAAIRISACRNSCNNGATFPVAASTRTVMASRLVTTEPLGHRLYVAYPADHGPARAVATKNASMKGPSRRQRAAQPLRHQRAAPPNQAPPVEYQ